MKLSDGQQAILERMEQGLPVHRTDVIAAQAAKDKGKPLPPLEVKRCEWSKDGPSSIIASRTVKKSNTGNPGIDYRVELYRIGKNGEVQRV